MDSTETYIKMCDCEEVQSHRPIKDPEPRILMFMGSFRYQVTAPLYGDYWARDWEQKIYIWLPRQDQIQEMLEEDTVTLSLRFHGWVITDQFVPVGEPMPSFEQLWLAFYMKERHGKVWTGSEWAVEVPA